ncbi:MAG: hypothetical protein U1E25_04645 [Methylocystis sp.]
MSRAISRTRKDWRRRAPSLVASPDDLFDYLQSPQRRAGRPVKHAVERWRVTDDWPERIPISKSEIEVYEAWFGDLFDRIFWDTR